MPMVAPGRRYFSLILLGETSTSLGLDRFGILATVKSYERSEGYLLDYFYRKINIISDHRFIYFLFKDSSSVNGK